MGTLILFIAFAIEGAFTAYRFITKSNQEKVKSYLRIGAFAAFVLFTLISVIQWNFTWYLLAALLFIWAMLGGWSLIRKPVGKPIPKPFFTVLRAIGAMLLVVIAVAAGPDLPAASTAFCDRKAPGRHRPVFLYQPESGRNLYQHGREEEGQRGILVPGGFDPW